MTSVSTACSRRSGRHADGRSRWRACQEAGVECRSKEYKGKDESLLAFVVSLNLHRRHLDASQRAMVAARLAKLRDGQRKPASPTGEAATTQAEAAALMNVGKRSVERARLVLDSGSRCLVSAVDEGTVSVSEAAEIARIVLPKQQEVANKAALQAERAERAERQERRRIFLEGWREELRAQKIKEARDAEIDGVVRLPSTRRYATALRNR